jgi:hypothetical protein
MSMRRIAVVPVVVVMVLAAFAVAAGGPASAAFGPAPVRPGAGQYVPLTPARIVNGDTIAADATYPLSVLGRGGVPTTNVSSVALTVTTRSSGNGHFIVYPAGSAVPGTSNLNYRPNIPTTNSVTMRLGTGSQLMIRNNADSTAANTVWVDVVGYYTANATAGAGSTYVGLTPARLRYNSATTPTSDTVVNPLGTGGVPATDVTAVVVDISVRANGTVGVASAYPDGTTATGTAAVNYQGDFVYTNQVTVKLGPNGNFRVHTTTNTQVTVDVVGYFQAPSGTAAGGTFVGVVPHRLEPVILAGGATHTLQTLGLGGIPTSGVTAVAFNLVSTQGQNSSVLTVHPAGTPRPTTTQVAYRGGPWPVEQYAKLGTNGAISIYNAGTAQVRLLIDLVGYYRAPAAPAAPTAVAAAAGDTVAYVTWTAPATDGGAAITGYRVTASPGGLTADVAGSETAAVFGNLTNATAYTFTVSAVNAAGRSAASGSSTAVTPQAATAPGAPTGVTAEARYSSATVRWQRPANDGHLPIDTYTVTATPGGAQATVTAPTTEATVRGLTNGTAYTFRVTSTNGRGTGPASAATAATVPAAGVPSAPTKVIAAPTGTDTITVEWGAPHYDGGQAVTGYTVTASPGGRVVTVDAAAIEADFTGLTSGTAYTFTVAARNASGTGALSTPTKPTSADLRLAPGARGLSDAAQATITVVNPAYVRFTNAPAEVTGLPVGTVLVVPNPPGAFSPFLRRVTGVTTSGTTTTVTTAEAELTDGFADGGFSLAAALVDVDSTGFGTMAIIDDVDTTPIEETEIAPGVTLSGTSTHTTRMWIEFDMFPAKLRVHYSESDRVDLTVVAEREALSIDFPKELKDGDAKPKKNGKVRGKGLAPGLQMQKFVTVKGSVKAGVTAKAAISRSNEMVIDIVHPDGQEFGLPDWKVEPQIPVASADANLTLGMRIDSTISLMDKQIAKVKSGDEIRIDIKTSQWKWLTIKPCVVLDIETFRVFGGRTPYKEKHEWCDKGIELTGLVKAKVEPGDVNLSRNGVQQFSASAPLGTVGMTWSVTGDGNGTIDRSTGRYTAPDKDGVFIVTATVPALGGRPPQIGTAYVRIGVPLKPTAVVVAPAEPLPQYGYPRVSLRITQPAGPVPERYHVRVQPREFTTYCPGTWTVMYRTDGDYLLIDGYLENGVVPTPCHTLLPGNSYRFDVEAHNVNGGSARTSSNTIVMPTAAAPAGAVRAGPPSPDGWQ